MNEPKLRFNEFNDDWKDKKLGKISSIVRGASPRPINDSKWFNSSSDIGWLRISDVTEQNGRVKKLNQHISKLGESKTRVLKEPHLLISIAATVGSPVINYTKTGVHDGFLIFKNPNFNKEFMFQWLLNFKPKWKKYGQSGSQLNLNSSIVNNQNINIPTYIEQEKIGSFFEKLDQLIQLQSDKLEHLKLTKKGYFQKIFINQSNNIPKLRFKEFNYSWNEKQVDNLFKVTRGNILSKNKISNIQDKFNSYPVYSSQTTNNGLLGYYKDYLYEDAITWTTDGANAGTVMFRRGKFFSTNVNGVLLSSKGYANKATSSIINNIAFKYVSHVGNPKLMNNTMKKIKIMIPKIEEQQRLSNFIDNIDQQITLQQQKLDNLKQQKKAYLQKMFI